MTKKTAMLVLALSLITNLAVGDIWQDMTKYKYGDEGDLPQQAEDLLQSTPVAEHGPIEQGLIKVIETKDGTSDGKAFACRMLQQVGTTKAIPALSAMLNDEVLSHYARLALERMGSPDATNAIREAVKDAPGKIKIGLVGSLGRLRDERFVKEAYKLTGHKDSEVAAAAIECLGRIGGKDGAKYLAKLKPDKDLEGVHMRALIDCGASVSGAVAMKLYEQALAGNTLACRVAAIRGMVQADEKKGTAAVANAIKGDDINMREGALTIVAGDQGQALTSAAAGLLKDLEGNTRAALIVALGARGDAAALEAIMTAISDKDAAVRNAAIEAVGKLGSAESVETLLSAASDPGVSDKIAATIVRMSSDGIDAALIKALDKQDIRVQTIKVLAARNHKPAVPAILGLTTDKDAAIRREAWVALATLARDENVGDMMKAVLAAPDQADLGSAHSAIRNVLAGAPDKNKCFNTVAALYDKAADMTRHFILDLGSSVGTPDALKLEQAALKSGNKAQRSAAIRALAAWCNETAAPDLLAIAKDAPEEVEKVLALRGYIRLAGLKQAKLSPKQRAEMLATAAGIASRDEEKRSIIATAKGIRAIESLELVDDFLATESVRKEAELSALDLARHIANQPERTRAVAVKLVDSKDKKIADQARTIVAECDKLLKK